MLSGCSLTYGQYKQLLFISKSTVVNNVYLTLRLKTNSIRITSDSVSTRLARYCNVLLLKLTALLLLIIVMTTKITMMAILFTERFFRVFEIRYLNVRKLYSSRIYVITMLLLKMYTNMTIFLVIIDDVSSPVGSRVHQVFK